MERPSLEHYRRVLREQGIELTESELRALREHVGRFARFIVDLYLEEQQESAAEPPD